MNRNIVSPGTDLQFKNMQGTLEDTVRAIIERLQGGNMAIPADQDHGSCKQVLRECRRRSSPGRNVVAREERPLLSKGLA